MIAAGKMRDRVTFLRKTETGKDPAYNTPVYEWRPIATVWAEVQQTLPSRSETQQEGIEVARQPYRIRCRYRSEFDSAMRIRIYGRDGELRIVSGPVELGRRAGLELMAEELTTEGAKA